MPVPLSRRTQAELEVLCGFTMKGWIPLDTLTYKGTFNGWPIEYSRTYTGAVDANGNPDMVTLDELQGATAFLAANGVEPASAPANMPVQHGGGAPQSYGGGPGGFPPPPPARQQPQGSQWACPIHQYQKIKPGYQGHGWECGVTTNFQPPYKARQWQGRNGPAWTCDEKSA